MKLIRPITIDDSVLTAGSVDEDDYAAWSSGTTYSIGGRCIKAHRIWESLIGSNLNHDPTAADQTQWADAGPTNRWAMFDDGIDTRTTATGSFSIELEPGAVNALAVLDTNAETVNVTMMVGATEIYNRTQSTNVGGSAITNWYLYFFEPVGKTKKLTFLDLRYVPGATIIVTFTAASPSADLWCGVLAVGRQRDLGMTEIGVELGLKDFSEKVTDRFGTRFVKGSFARTMTVRTKMPPGSEEAVQDMLAQYRGVSLVWIGEPGRRETIVFGIYNSFKINLALPTVSYCSLDIEGGSES